MKWYIAAAILMLVGTATFVIAMSINKWDFTKLSTTEYETNEYEITEEFSNISIDSSTVDIVFEKSENDLCKVVCYEDVNWNHEVKVEDGTLVITEKDERKPSDYININFNLNTSKLTVYLPTTEYEMIRVHTSTGNIKIGGVKVDTMKLKVSTGKVSVDSVECVNGIEVNVSTGDVYLTDVSCSSLTSEGTTGKIILNKVIATEKFNIKRSTGDVKFEDCDAFEVEVNTSTGNIKGNFLTSKIITAKSSTGDVDVPKNTEGGKCEITTSTGDIKIK